MNNQLKKTKIVATLGPSSSDYETIKKLVEKGVSVFRINTSHGEKQEHAKKIKIIRDIEKELNKNLPIIIDLQGPKIRIGQIKEPVFIEKGQEIILEYTDRIKKGKYPLDSAEMMNAISKSNPVLHSVAGFLKISLCSHSSASGALLLPVFSVRLPTFSRPKFCSLPQSKCSAALRYAYRLSCTYKLTSFAFAQLFVL